MKVTKIMTVAATMFMATVANAQMAKSSATSIYANECDNYTRVYADYGTTTFKESEDGFSATDDNAMKGFSIGALRAFNVTGKKLPVFVEAGLEFSARFYTEDKYSDATQKDELMRLTIPVNLTYKLSFKNGMYVSPFAGARLAYNMIGKSIYKYDGESYSEDWLNGEDDEDSCNKVQIGAQVGATIGYKKLSISFGYQWDGKLYSEEDAKITTNGFRVGVGYSF